MTPLPKTPARRPVAWRAVLWLACLAALSPVPGRTESPALGPRLAATPSVWVFGRLTNCSVVRHDFTLRNTGDTDLRILSVAPDCPLCLTAGLDHDVIPAGGTAVVHCHLDLREKDGAVSQQVRLRSNDPRTPEVELTLAGEVVPLYQCSPTGIILDLSQGQRSAGVEILARQKLRSPLTTVVCDDSNLVTRLVALDAQRYSLQVRALPTTPPGRFLRHLILRSADTNDEPCSLTAFINHPFDFEVLPAQLHFSAASAPQIRILWLKQSGAETLDLLDVVLPGTQYACEIESDANGPNYRLYLTAVGLDRWAGWSGELGLKLRDRQGRRQDRSVPMAVSLAKLE